MSSKLQIAIATGASVLTFAAVAQAATAPEPAPVAGGAARLAPDLENVTHGLTRNAAPADEVRTGLKRLHEKIKKERAKEATGVPADAVTATTVAGVPRSTLEAIAACESGGNPAAVNAAGYYGKYQFDMGTWASVGGSGNPAEASEEEQDYRAALLYQRAGSSPWPVCGL